MSFQSTNPAFRRLLFTTTATISHKQSCGSGVFKSSITTTVSKRGYLEGFNANYFLDGNTPNHHLGVLKNHKQFSQMLKPPSSSSRSSRLHHFPTPNQPQSQFSSNIDPCYRIELYQDVPVVVRQPQQSTTRGPAVLKGNDCPVAQRGYVGLSINRRSTTNSSRNRKEDI